MRVFLPTLFSNVVPYHYLFLSMPMILFTSSVSDVFDETPERHLSGNSCSFG